MNEILAETIQSYNEYLTKVSPGCLQIAHLLRQDDIGGALRMILQFSEGMNWLVEARELFVQNGVKATLEVEKIHEFLNEINNGLEILDYVIVADMFEYEIAPFFEEVKIIEGIGN